METHPAPTGRKMHKSEGILKSSYFHREKDLTGRISVYSCVCNQFVIFSSPVCHFFGPEKRSPI